MTEAILVLIYLTALSFGSIALHLRFGPITAASLAGFTSAFLTTAAFVVLEGNATNPEEYVATFWYGGISLWIISTLVSALIGLPCQRKKRRNNTSEIDAMHR